MHNKSNTQSLNFNYLKRKLRYLYDYREFSQRDFLACALAYTLAGTALRISEVLQITTEMVDKGEIFIKQKRGEVKSIDLPEGMVQVLKEYSARCQ